MAQNLQQFLEEKVADLELRALIEALAEGCRILVNSRDVWAISGSNYIGKINQSGDQQIELDHYTDNLFYMQLDGKKLAYGYVSEERGDAVDVIDEGKKYTVAIDPLDGSSLVGTNLAVGTIIGIYDSQTMTGRVGAKLVASMYAVYGPQLVLVLVVNGRAYKFVLKNSEQVFVLKEESLKVAPTTTYFAPGGLAQVNEDPRYKELVDYWISHSYKLRYSGGMVPDVHHILAKGQGVFAYPGLPTKPEGKLRVLYEAMPMAQIMEAAGGKAHSGRGRILDIEVHDLHQSTPICLGSSEEVERFIAKFAE
jgi:fructose-1,6-bisphosphatase I